ncbi:MAG: acyltransferase, partial [Acidimicrobiia bacterium]|nr:acyltransferase [Acidimicrobiia bacterium]
MTQAQSQLYRPARPGREFRATALGQPVPSVATEMRARRQVPLGSSEPEDRQALSHGTVPQAPRYLPGLDGLRAVAVAAVVAYHLGELPGGFLGVDVFFVISGFLITRLLLAEHERTGRIAIGAFWGRRFRRLLPALLVLLVAVALASRAELPGWRLTEIRNDAFGALAYVANWRFVLSGESYFTKGVGPSPLRHTWSLAIEEQFYLLWPLVVAGVLAMARRAARLSVGAVALAVGVGSAVWMAVVSGQGHDLSRIYYGTDTRVFALCGGAWLASWWDPAAAAASRPARRRHRERWALAGTMAVVRLGMLAVFAVTDHAAFY